MLVKLSKPITIGVGDGAKTVSELTMDLDALTANDIKMCLRETKAATGERNVVPIVDESFHDQLAARAAGIPVEALALLSGADYLRVTQRVRNFLLSLD